MTTSLTRPRGLDAQQIEGDPAKRVCTRARRARPGGGRALPHGAAAKAYDELDSLNPSDPMFRQIVNVWKVR